MSLKTATACDRPHSLTAAEARRRIRSGKYTNTTAGLAEGKLQSNVVILPAEYARDFENFCKNNPKPCPLNGMTPAGNPMFDALGKDIDIRTDVPSYNVYRYGELSSQVSDIAGLWQGDFTAFALGCSFTFEHALLKANIPLRHIDDGHTVSMFATSIETVSSGPFHGPMVVSMRPIREELVEQVNKICTAFPHAHGAPIHSGNPDEIGIKNIENPEWGQPTRILPDEIPVFWACGVTPQNVLATAKPPICITHTPGCMLITDIPDDIVTQLA